MRKWRGVYPYVKSLTACHSCEGLPRKGVGGESIDITYLPLHEKKV
jgi:hypothetical protein